PQKTLFYFRPHHDLLAVYQNGALDQVGIFAHQLERFFARGRIVLHAALAVELIPSVQKIFVVALADEFLQLRYGQALIQVDLVKFDASCAKGTLRVAAGGSSRLEIEFHHSQFSLAERSPVRCRNKGSRASNA